MAFHAARYDVVLDRTAALEADGAGGAEVIALRAEALLRRDPIDALAWLAGADALITDDAAQFAYELATARAYAAVTNFEAAEARLSAAAALAGSVAGGEAQIALQRGRLRYLLRELDPRDGDLGLAERTGDPATRVEAAIVRAAAHALREDYAGQVAGLRTALDLAERHADAVPVRLLANAVYVLARIGFEIADADATAHAARAYDTVAWSPELAVERFQTLRALGWDAYVRGEAGRAQWLFRDAAACAPSRAWETMARLDRAFVARLSCNDAWAAEELENAERLAADVVWSATVGEERVVLATLAQLLAPVDLARAQRYAATYTALGTRGMDPALLTADVKDRRNEATRRYVTGCLERVAGNGEAAATTLRLAYSFFDAVGYRFRAALTAADLYEVTGDAVWRERSRTQGAAYPGSPLIGAGAGDGERRDPILDLLSPFGRQLARVLWEGPDDERRLCERFSRSRYTIRRETDTVLTAFGVTSRAQLRDAAIARGLA